MGHVTLTTPLLQVICHPKAGDSIQPTCVQNLTILVLAIPDMIGSKNLKWVT